ncbi:MAG: sulfurtransferase-like selenium metabolism protein YedF [Bacillota bacterium]
MSQPKIVDCRGLSCPLPVVNTKKALDEMAAGSPADFVLTALVDNDTAAENVSRFARSSGCRVELEKKEDGIYIHITKPGTAQASTHTATAKELEQALPCCSGENREATAGNVLLITSSSLGRGSEELGKILMRSFIFTLQEADTPPARIFFLNSGVFLTAQGSPVLEELQELADRGVEIFSCGTCLDYYQLKEKLQVGRITNMYDTVDAILASARCITV